LRAAGEGFTSESTLAELSRWWLDHVVRHRVKVTTWSAYYKQLRLVNGTLGDVSVHKLRPEQVAAFLSKLIDSGSASRATNVRTLRFRFSMRPVNLGLAEDNLAKKVRRPRVPKERVER
jgi:hypothetical protein